MRAVEGRKTADEIDWGGKYIHSNPDILLGKPVVKGTGFTVEFIPGLFAAGS